MNIMDLLIMGIEAQMSKDEKFVEDAIVFRFRKDEMYYERIIKRKEIMDFNGGAISSSFFEDRICHEVMEHFQVMGSDQIMLQIGQWVICAEGGVVGRICKFYTPTGAEEQIMVNTRDGRKFHAPAKLWKPYQFGATTNQVCTDELAFMNVNPNLTSLPELLNAHGEYAARFARNHGISISDAMDHPTVKAHLEYFNKMTYDQKVLKEVSPKINEDILTKNLHTHLKGRE